MLRISEKNMMNCRHDTKLCDTSVCVVLANETSQNDAMIKGRILIIACCLTVAVMVVIYAPSSMF